MEGVSAGNPGGIVRGSWWTMEALCGGIGRRRRRVQLSGCRAASLPERALFASLRQIEAGLHSRLVDRFASFQGYVVPRDNLSELGLKLKPLLFFGPPSCKNRTQAYRDDDASLPSF